MLRFCVTVKQGNDHYDSNLLYGHTNFLSFFFSLSLEGNEFWNVTEGESDKLFRVL